MLTTLRIAAMALALACSMLSSCYIVNDRRVNSRFMPDTGVEERDGAKFRTQRAGSGNQPVVFVHGNPGTMDDFAEVVARLSPTTFATVSYDRPGHGFSERRDSWGIDEQLKCLDEMVRSVGPKKPIVVAHSWGCGLALLYCEWHRDSVAGLVLVAPEVFMDADLSETAADVTHNWWFVSQLYLWTVGPIIDLFAASSMLQGAFEPTKAYDVVSYPIVTNTHLFSRTSQIEAMIADEEEIADEFERFWDGPMLPAVPMLILVGTHDEITRPHKHAQRLHKALPKSVLVEIPYQGHMLPMTQPDIVARGVECMERWSSCGLPTADERLRLLEYREW